MTTLMRRNRMYPSFPSIIDEIFNRESFNGGFDSMLDRADTRPSVNIKDTEDSYEIELAAPGMDKKDFNIELDKDLLTIFAEKKGSNKEENEPYSRKEFSYNSFSRSFTLPKDKVETEKIKAEYENGILVLGLPKKAEAKPQPARVIEIS